MNRTISIPEEIYRQAVELADQRHISVEELVSAALSEQFAGWEYLRRRGARASLDRFRAALEQIPDAEPDPHDLLK